jgi:putative spermidine/putrescine transport system permease protein
MAQPRTSAWLMLLVLVPFWLSILARTAAWIIMLQGSGPVNSVLMWAGLTDTPLQLVFNRFGVVLVMVHVMLPCASAYQFDPCHSKILFSGGG